MAQLQRDAVPGVKRQSVLQGTRKRVNVLSEHPEAGGLAAEHNRLYIVNEAARAACSPAEHKIVTVLGDFGPRCVAIGRVPLHLGFFPCLPHLTRIINHPVLKILHRFQRVNHQLLAVLRKHNSGLEAGDALLEEYSRRIIIFETCNFLSLHFVFDRLVKIDFFLAPHRFNFDAVIHVCLVMRVTDLALAQMVRIPNYIAVSVCIYGRIWTLHKQPLVLYVIIGRPRPDRVTWMTRRLVIVIVLNRLQGALLMRVNRAQI